MKISAIFKNGQCKIVLKPELRKLLYALNMIIEMTDHQIPYYAYGDNQAACEMAQRLADIKTQAEYTIIRIEHIKKR